MNMKTEVIVQGANGIVYAREEEEIGRLEFDISEDHITILHTYTYEGFKGRGVGKQLVESAIKWAEEKRLKVLPICSFAKIHMERHPEYAKLLMEKKQERICRLRKK